MLCGPAPAGRCWVWRAGLSVPDPGTRGYVERNSIALTSQLAAGQDPPGPGWFGHHATQPRSAGRDCGTSGTSRTPATPHFLPTLEQLIQHHQ